MSNFRLTLKLLVANVKLHLILGKTTNILATIKYTTFTVQNVRTIVLRLRCFLNQVETDKIKKFCNAASTDEKLFWKLLQVNVPSSQMSCFLVDGKNLSQIMKQIREMWAGHFDSDFLTRVTANVQEIFTSCTDDPIRSTEWTSSTWGGCTSLLTAETGGLWCFNRLWTCQICRFWSLDFAARCVSRIFWELHDS